MMKHFYEHSYNFPQRYVRHSNRSKAVQITSYELDKEMSPIIKEKTNRKAVAQRQRSFFNGFPMKKKLKAIPYTDYYDLRDINTYRHDEKQGKDAATQTAMNRYRSFIQNQSSQPERFISKRRDKFHFETSTIKQKTHANKNLQTSRYDSRAAPVASSSNYYRQSNTSDTTRNVSDFHDYDCSWQSKDVGVRTPPAIDWASNTSIASDCREYSSHTSFAQIVTLPCLPATQFHEGNRVDILEERAYRITRWLDGVEASRQDGHFTRNTRSKSVDSSECLEVSDCDEDYQNHVSTVRNEKSPCNNKYEKSPCNNKYEKSPCNNRYEKSICNNRYEESPCSDRYEKSPYSNRYEESPCSNRYEKSPCSNNNRYEKSPCNNKYEDSPCKISVPQPVLYQKSQGFKYDGERLKSVASVVKEFEGGRDSQTMKSEPVKVKQSISNYIQDQYRRLSDDAISKSFIMIEDLKGVLQRRGVTK